MARMYGYDSPVEMLALVDNFDRQIYNQAKRWDALKVYLDRFEKITDAESVSGSERRKYLLGQRRHLEGLG